MKTPTSIPVAAATDSPRLSGDDLEEIIAQRAEEIRRFRLAGVSIPTLKAGEEIRVVEADFSAARMHTHLPESSRLGKQGNRSQVGRPKAAIRSVARGLLGLLLRRNPSRD